GEAITLLFDFENGVEGEDCSATFASFSPLLSVEGEATLRHGANSQECAFDSLSLLLNQPASHVGFRTTGNADLLLGLNGSQNRYPLADAGYFHAVRPAGLDALILQGNNGQELVGLDDLRLSFTVKTALIRQDF